MNRGTVIPTLPHMNLIKTQISPRIRAISLRKQAYSNILKILPPKNENFQIKNFNILHISDQNINLGYSLEPPQ